ncbi:MAG TPA: CAP domain-containing protein [Alphaproteobacteria bacterium]|nr:CAP domain-containing protein [Alphaproteobacteria bacterium]
MSRNIVVTTIKRCAVLGALLLGTLPAAVAAELPNPMVTNHMLAVVNQVRERAGLNPVAANPQLMGIAQSLANDLAARRGLSHVDSQGNGIGKRFTQAGYIYAVAVEAVAGGSASAEETVNQWMAEPQNRDVLLNPAVTDAGIGYAYRADESNNRGLAYYWVLDLGSAVERGPGP